MIKKLRSTCFWNIAPSSSSTWIWRKLLSLREQFRPFFIHAIGDGNDINAWEDKWLPVGHLSQFLSNRSIRALQFTPSSTVSDVLNEISNSWPLNWIRRCPALAQVPVPVAVAGVRDQLSWMDQHGLPTKFIMSSVWHSLDGPHENVFWFEFCWFKGNIPKHAFCLWLALQGKLLTQDRMIAWRSDSDLRCSLCKDCMDSHSHLFFNCPYSNKVWKEVKAEMQDHLICDNWDEILEEMRIKRWRAKSMRQKLLFSAAVYHLWIERNSRLFTDKIKPEDLLVKDIVRVVELRLKGNATHAHHGNQ